MVQKFSAPQVEAGKALVQSRGGLKEFILKTYFCTFVCLFFVCIAEATGLAG